MSEFLQFISSPAIGSSLAAALLSSVACGIVGPYVVVRRITYIAGGIAHSVLGGLGAAHYLQQVHGWNWLQPIYGAVVAALLAALIIGYVSLRHRQREDTIISALWAIGMAMGLMFIWATPGYSTELMRFLFGDILLVPHNTLMLLIALDVLLVAVVLVCYQQLTAVCFDAEFARLRGLNVSFYYILLLCLTALTVVLLVQVVGVVLVIALLALPTAAAEALGRKLWQMMLIAMLLCAAFTVSGIFLSYGPDLRPAPVIVLIAAVVYLLSLALRSMLRRRRV